jgi:uncharacterized GH25 family protein
LVLGLAHAASAAAHDTWLQPRSWSVRPGQTLRVDLTSGMGFPALDHAVRGDRIARAAVRLAGTEAALRKSALSHSLHLDAPLPAPGVATIWVELKPWSLTLTPEQITEYLDEIGAKETIGPLWSRIPEPKQWRETYRKHAKTYVRVGDAAGDESWRTPVGMPLELVPESDPTALRSGDVLRLKLLRGGAPLAGVALTALYEGAKQRLSQQTDVEGRASFALDAAGAWLLAATDLRQATGGEWESDFATLTIRVQVPTPKAP